MSAYDVKNASLICSYHDHSSLPQPLLSSPARISSPLAVHAFPSSPFSLEVRHRPRLLIYDLSDVFDVAQMPCREFPKGGGSVLRSSRARQGDQSRSVDAQSQRR